MIAFLAPAAGEPGPPILAAKTNPRRRNIASILSCLTPFAAQVALYMPSITGTRTRHQGVLRKETRHIIASSGEEYEGEGPCTPDAAQQ